MHEPADGALDRRHLAERLAHGRNLVGAGRLRDLAAQAEQETHLRPVAHVRLVIAEAVAGRLDVDVAREQRIVVHEHLLPRHLDVRRTAPCCRFRRSARPAGNRTRTWQPSTAGLRDHSVSPGALHGTAQVIASFFWSGASGMTLPIQISLA